MFSVCKGTAIFLNLECLKKHGFLHARNQLEFYNISDEEILRKVCLQKQDIL